jgi:L-amino acid N-acyltransferase YncA
MALRALRDADLEPLAEIQRAHAGEMAPVTADELQRSLHDEARERGANVVVGVRDGRVVGAAAWVHGDRALFIAPLVAVDAEAAGELADACHDRARGAAWIRVATGARSSPIADALAARGYTCRSEFVDLARPTASGAPSPPDWIAIAGVDREQLRALYNATFRDVPSARSVTRAELDESLADIVDAGTGVIARDGSYAGFLIAQRHRGLEPHVEIEAVGVADAHRGHGIARALVANAIAAAHRAGFAEIRARVSSLNAASLALHTRLGFTPKYRRFIWQRDLR